MKSTTAFVVFPLGKYLTKTTENRIPKNRLKKKKKIKKSQKERWACRNGRKP
jgi:hypothetical protein